MAFSVTGLAILLLACIGNTELWVIFINRYHARPYRHSVLQRIRRIHDVGILCFPPFLLAYAGLGEHGLLNGGSPFEQSIAMQGILAITLAGIVPLVGGSLRWNFRKTPSQHIESSSHRLDCLNLPGQTSEMRQQVVGEADSVLAGLPWNQIYHLDANRKRIRISSRVSAEAPGDRKTSKPQTILRLAHFSDTHFVGTPGPEFHRIVVEQLCAMQPDAFFFTGDLLDRDDLIPAAAEMFRSLLTVAPGYFILGNHDWHLDPVRIRSAIVDTGWIDISERSELITIGEQTVLLAGTEAPWMGQNPEVPAYSGEDLRLLLSHAPDQRNFAIENNFDLMLCGHNHGGQVVLPIIGPVYTPSIYGVQYAGGLFEHKGMIMHVSRGVGAKDLLRWNCCPEITLMELELG